METYQKICMQIKTFAIFYHCPARTKKYLVNLNTFYITSCLCLGCKLVMIYSSRHGLDSQVCWMFFAVNSPSAPSHPHHISWARTDSVIWGNIDQFFMNIATKFYSKIQMLQVFFIFDTSTGSWWLYSTYCCLKVLSIDKKNRFIGRQEQFLEHRFNIAQRYLGPRDTPLIKDTPFNGTFVWVCV